MQEDAKRPLVLITDDDGLVREALKIGLEEHFDVEEAASGVECLGRVARRQPALVFLDIEMDGMSGYECCRRLRASFDMPIVFVSAHDTLEERLEAFAAGADDFVSKPFDGDEVRLKAMRLIDRHMQLATTRAEHATLQEFTDDLMQDVGRKDVVFSFMRRCMDCVDYEELARNLLDATAQYSVRCHIQVRHDAEATTLTPAGAASPLELSVLEKCVDLGAQFRFGRRLVVNCGDISILVLQLPESLELAARISEKLLVLAECGAAFTETIRMRKESARRAETLQNVTAASSVAVAELRDMYRAQQTETRFLLQRLIDDVEAQYVHLGMTERQEAVMTNTVRGRAEEILRLFDANEGFESQFASILASLDHQASESANCVWLF